MKLPEWIFLALLIGSCTSPSPQPKNTPAEKMTVNVQELEQKGFDLYQESPVEAIPIFQQVASTYETNGNLPKAGITYLNIANIYDEHAAQMDSALIYAEKALAIWNLQQDTLQLANLYKYVGLLKGRVGSLEAGKKDIELAIDLYQQLAFGPGVAVSQLNLAEVYLREGHYAASESLFTQSKAFWQTDGDLGRVFTTNLLGIQLYHQLSDSKQLELLIAENEAILERIQMDAYNRDRFDALKRENTRGAE
jgi:tetratricopeptide (TPR) repeat protein